jgi:hypothetical protein
MLYISQDAWHPERIISVMNQSASKPWPREFLTAMAAYVIVLPICILLISASPHSAWWRIPLALIPVIPILFAMRAFMRFFSSMDELQRRIQLEAFAFSFGATGIVTFSYGLLTDVGFPVISWTWIFPLMIALWGIGQGVATRRYR